MVADIRSEVAERADGLTTPPQTDVNVFVQLESFAAPTEIEGRGTASDISRRGGVWYMEKNFTSYDKTMVDGELLKPVYLPPWLLQVPEDLVVSVVDKHHEI